MQRRSGCRRIRSEKGLHRNALFKVWPRCVQIPVAESGCDLAKTAVADGIPSIHAVLHALLGQDRRSF